MKKFINILIVFIATACNTHIQNIEITSQEINIFPDYKDVEIPCNIAPINFTIIDTLSVDALIISNNTDSMICDVNDHNTDIDIDDWHNYISKNKGQNLQFTLCYKNGSEWLAYKPFNVKISTDSIDKTLVYRLIPPGYENWNQMGIFQRNLENFVEKPIYENRFGKGNCVNCHSFCNGNPNKMMLHIRSKLAGTYIFTNNKTDKIKADFSKKISNPTYPYWHPSGNFIAFSLNSINQDFHTSNTNRIEVYDNTSDVIVYDIINDAILTTPIIASENSFETFPCFSPDGKWLYYCSAEAHDSVRWNTEQMKYNICKIAFDANSLTFGNKIDTIFDAKSINKSASFPRISPDGQYLLYTLHNYGNFSIWHKDADLQLIKLSTLENINIDIINSNDTESYHSWCSNSKWIVFSSRRNDGLFTQLFIAHIDDNGNASKPMLLPQINPYDFYQMQFYSYNIPELVKSDIELSSFDIDKKIRLK